MKTRTLLLASLPLLGLAACSNDDSFSPKVDNSAAKDEITFAPTFDHATRAASLYDSNTKPTQFVVGAFHIDSIGDRKPFFLGDQYEYTDGQWTNVDGTRYWPDGGSTDFYALVLEPKPTPNIMWQEAVQNLSKIHTQNLFSAYVPLYQIDPDATKQYDALYAVTKDQHRNGNPVPLNFRHVMSQVVFDAMNVSKNIYVEISGVSVENINMQLAVTLPNKTTSPSTLDDDFSYAALTPLTKGYYRGRSYATFPTVALPGNPDETVAPTPLTTTDPSLAMLLSPAQSDEMTAGVDPTHPNAYATDTKDVFPYKPNPSAPMLGKGGQALKVNCTIWEVKDPSKGHDPAVDVELWGAAGGAPKELIVPVDISNWMPGKRFTYTLVFGKGSAGYDPDNDQPVLAPITYDITVDDFVDMSSKVNL